jgi:hypothetical protein
MYAYDNQNWLNSVEAAEYLFKRGARGTAGTLATLRSRGAGPPFRKVRGQILYSETALDKWIEANRSPEVNSTADLRKRRSE